MGEKISFIDLFGTELELEDEYAREQLAGESAARAEDVALLSARMDTFTALPDGSTAGDAELTDIRVGADGVTYANAGDAVRRQNKNLENKLDNITNYGERVINHNFEKYWVNNGVFNPNTDSLMAIIPMKNCYNYTVFAIGGQNRFRIYVSNVIENGMEPTEVYRADPVHSVTGDSYTYSNTNNYKYLLCFVGYQAVENDITFTVAEIFGDHSQPFKVTGVTLYTKNEVDNLIENAIESTKADYFETVNKNFFDVNTITENYSVSSSDGELAYSLGYNASDYIPIEPNTEYTFSTRWTVAFYDANKVYISGSPGSQADTKTLTSPANANYLRFAYSASNASEIRVNEGSTLLPYEPYGGIINPEYLPSSRYSLVCDTVKNFKGFSNATSNFCLIASKVIYGDVPEYDGFLLLDETENKLYYANGQLDEITYLCDWNFTLSNNVVCSDYLATITADGDIIFLRKWERENPIVYPHGDYTNPFTIDFGSNLKPYGFLSSASCVQFSDGSFVFGEYTPHDIVKEQNNDPRNIWRVTKPYNNPSNWSVVHRFKHVSGDYELTEPNNEIGHIHTVSYDFYNDDLFCTTGDFDRHCRVWKSTDKGATWAEVASNGQKYRSVGLVFNEKGCYYGTDSFYGQHNLWLAPRAQTGECDFVNIEKITSLEPVGRNGSQATYGTILLKEPNGLLFLDRAEPREDNLLDIPFYSFDNKKLYFIATFEKSIFNSMEYENRNGLCNQFFTEYQPTTTDFVLAGGGKIIRPNTDNVLNNSADNYIGLIKMRVVRD